MMAEQLGCRGGGEKHESFVSLTSSYQNHLQDGRQGGREGARRRGTAALRALCAQQCFISISGAATRTDDSVLARVQSRTGLVLSISPGLPP